MPGLRAQGAAECVQGNGAKVPAAVASPVHPARQHLSACGEPDELLLLGARNATMGSQVVESTWASVFNDDKKLIAFSSVECRAPGGVFGALTSTMCAQPWPMWWTSWARLA